jgi:hypothetical protein
VAAVDVHACVRVNRIDSREGTQRFAGRHGHHFRRRMPHVMPRGVVV